MRTLRSILFLVFISSTVNAQFNISLNTGIGKYSLKDMHQYQNATVADYPAGARITSDFPQWYTYGVDVKNSTDKMQVGLSTTVGSTGGRVYYSDYSGQEKSEQTMTFTSIGAIIGKRWSFMNNRFDVVIDPRPMIVFTRVQSNYSQRISGDIGNNNVDQGYTYNNLNAAIQPTLSLGAHFGPLTITGYAGYNLMLTSHPMMLMMPTTPPNDLSQYTVNWSGLRAGGSIGINFNKSSVQPDHPTEVAFGLGIDYGGVGLKLTQYLTRNVGVFAGIGYNLNKVGFNGGAKLKLSKDYEKRVQPFLMWMYGYNAVIIMKDKADYNRTFYGSSVGFGLDINRRRYGKATYAIIVPVRNSDANAYMDQLRMLGAQFKNKLWPVLFSIGVKLPEGK